jgi:hypothetical protein
MDSPIKPESDIEKFPGFLLFPRRRESSYTAAELSGNRPPNFAKIEGAAIISLEFTP